MVVFSLKKVNDFAAIIALKCETDFVANGADFIKLTSDILDAAIAAKCHTLDEVKALALGASDVQAAVTQRSVSLARRWSSMATMYSEA